jgi:hypothetical protein
MGVTIMAEKSLYNRILVVGNDIRKANAKAGKLNQETYDELVKGMSKTATTANWFARFVSYVEKNGLEWPRIDKGKRAGEPVGYQTILRNTEDYSNSHIALASFFNQFLAGYLNRKGLIEKSKDKNKNGKANILTADDVINVVKQLWESVPEESKEEQSKQKLIDFAKEAFGLEIELY